MPSIRSSRQSDAAGVHVTGNFLYEVSYKTCTSRLLCITKDGDHHFCETLPSEVVFLFISQMNGRTGSHRKTNTKTVTHILQIEKVLLQSRLNMAREEIIAR